MKLTLNKRASGQQLHSPVEDEVATGGSQEIDAKTREQLILDCVEENEHLREQNEALVKFQ